MSLAIQYAVVAVVVGFCLVMAFRFFRRIFCGEKKGCGSCGSVDCPMKKIQKKN